ncbi:MAG: thioredoxin family protein [Planctomycetaceae bacterium]
MNRTRIRAIELLMWLSASGLAYGGEFNPTLSIGDAAPVWTGLPGVDGKQHSSDSLPAKQLALVVFTCNSCPVARDYEDRLIALTGKYEGQVSVTAINVNLIPDDSLEKMQSRALERKFNFPYLFDETQQIARDFGANGTPECFLLSAEEPVGGGVGPGVRTLLYQGAMDDSSIVAEVKVHFLDDAIVAALAGRPAPKLETYAHGCRVRYKRERRREKGS